MRRTSLLVASLFLTFALWGCDASSQAGLTEDGEDVNSPLIAPTPCETHEDCVDAVHSDSCFLGMCDDETGMCVAMPMPDGTVCSIEVLCGARGQCAAGVCEAPTGEAGDCDDGNPCTVDVCVPESGCGYQAVEDGRPCDDANECTAEDQCAVGVCLGSPIDGCEENRCGNEECGDEESCDSCPEDCGPCDAPGCGDGICADDESPDSCPGDCPPGPTVETMPCLQDGCDLGQCLEFQVCINALGCMADCEDPECAEWCLLDVPPAGQDLLGGVLACGMDLGCWGGDEPPPEPVCGDGVCEDGENADWCPDDCEEEPPPPEENLVECVLETCPTELMECLTDPVCAGAIECLVGCGQDQGCLTGCLTGGGFSLTILAVANCAWQSGCLDGGGGDGPVCGNQDCEEGENPQNCPEDCQGGGGGCGDGVCEQFEEWTCPEDCDGGGGGCGDGVCEGAEQFTCPEDCQDGGGGCGDGVCDEFEEWTCPEDCEDGGGGCGDGVCEGAEQWTCPEDCEDGGGGCGDGVCEGAEQWTCPEDCEDGWGGDCGDGACGEGENQQTCPADCFPGQGKCGNGQCEGDENVGNCPSDCQDGGGPECGNGVCEDGEGPNTCPQDCKTDGIGSCEAKCGGEGSGGCWCDVPCKEMGDCCADYEKYCSEDTPPPAKATWDCLVEGCNTGQCLNYQGCTNGLTCMAECPGPACAEACLDDVPGPAVQTLEGVLGCGIEIGCWETDDPGPDPDTKCGDGVCAESETQSCPADCYDGGLTGCLKASCGAELETCWADQTCHDAYPCLEECWNAGGQGCTQQCMPESGSEILWDLGTCGGQGGCANSGG